MGLARSERPNRGRTVIEVGTSAVRGQYGPGIIEGKKVSGYRAHAPDHFVIRPVKSHVLTRTRSRRSATSFSARASNQDARGESVPLR